MKGFYFGNLLGAHEILKYSEKNGELWYEYRKGVEVSTQTHRHVYQRYTSSGKIPDDIFMQGEKKTEKYVRQKIARDLKRQQKKISKFETFAKNPDFPVQTEYNGTILKGRIISANDSTLRVRLEEPRSACDLWIRLRNGRQTYFYRQRDKVFRRCRRERAKTLAADIR